MTTSHKAAHKQENAPKTDSAPDVSDINVGDIGVKQEPEAVEPEKAPKTDNAGNLLNSKGDIVDGEGDVRYFAGTYTLENGNNVDLYKRRILPDQPRKAP